MEILPSEQQYNFSEFGLLATGLNKIDDRTLSIYTYGQSRVVFDSIGNVGIGVTGIDDVNTLSNKLEVDNGNVYIHDDLTVAGSLNLPGKTLLSGGTLCLFDNDETISSDGIVMTFGVGGSERMRINNSGSVGIGTNNSLTPLHVNGTIRTENFSSGDTEIQLKSGLGNRWDIIAGDTTSGTNPLRFGNNGNDYINILENGNVGVGTTNATENLHVAGNTRIDGDLIVHGDNLFLNSTTVTTADNMIKLADNNQANATDFGFYGMHVDTGVTYYSGFYKDASAGKWILFDSDTTEPSITHTTTDAYFVVDTNNSRIGIGTQSPASQLNLYDSSSPTIELTNASNNSKIYQSSSNLVLEADGDVNVNETTSAKSVVNFTNSDASSGSDIGIDASENLTVWNKENTAMLFGTNATERIRITAAGNVGIGTNNPQTELHLYSSTLSNFRIESADSTAANIQFRNSTATSGSNIGIDGNEVLLIQQIESNDIAFNTNGTERMRILAGGNVGIGIDAPVQNLHVHEPSTASGGIQITNNNTGTTATDGFFLQLGSADNVNLLNYSNTIMTFGNNGTVDMTLTASGDLNMASGNKIQEDGSDLVPAGCIMMWSTASAPGGWLICDGAAVSRTTYAVLFGVIGTTYGSGDGSTTFNLPNMSGRTALGVGNSGNTHANVKALADTGGDEAVSLQTDNLPTHSHLVQITSAADGSHSHTVAITSAEHLHALDDGNANAAAASDGAHTHLVELNTGNHTHEVQITSAEHTHLVELNTGNHTHQVQISGAQHTHPVQLNTNNTGGHSHNYTVVQGTTECAGNNRDAYQATGNASTSNDGNHSHTVQGNTGQASFNYSGNTGNATASIQGNTNNATAAVQGDTGNATATVQGNTNSGGAHTHTISGNTGNSTVEVQGNTGNVSTHTHSVQGATGNVGLTVATPTVTSYLTLNYIIKT